MAAPRRGDLVWLDFDPQAGREQSGRRPALVLSPQAYHQASSLMIVCPVTSTRRGHPFEVPLPDGLRVQGVVLVDQVKSLDRHTRRVEPVDRAPASVMEEVMARLLPLLTGGGMG